MVATPDDDSIRSTLDSAARDAADAVDDVDCSDAEAPLIVSLVRALGVFLVSIMSIFIVSMILHVLLPQLLPL